MVYLDNAATTPMDEEVMERIQEAMRDSFANSSASYRIGLDAKSVIERSIQSIKEYLTIINKYEIK